MKVQLNTITNYEGKPLKSGDEIDIPLNIAQRWINKGIAHIPEEIPFSDFVPSKKEEKIIDEYIAKVEKPKVFDSEFDGLNKPTLYVESKESKGYKELEKTEKTEKTERIEKIFKMSNKKSKKK